MTARKNDRIATPPRPETTGKDSHPDDSAVKDRKASRGDRYANPEKQSPGAEGNDPSHLAGRTFTRRVPRKP